jgi:hypothetical protein
MTANNISRITQDEINQLKKFRGKVEDVLDGVERWLPEDNPHRTPEELAALREMEKYPRKDSLYTPKELTAVLKEDKVRCWSKAEILFSKSNFNSIRRITEPRWPTDWSIFKEAWDEIDAIFERGPNTNSFERDTSGRFRPGCAASEGFVRLIESLNYIIGKLTEQKASEAELQTGGSDKADGRATGQDGRGDKTGKSKRGRRKIPPQLLKETRERQGAEILAKNPGMTCRELAKKLECDGSTVTRLKAWKNRGVVSAKRKKGFVKYNEDGDRIGVEAIDDGE